MIGPWRVHHDAQKGFHEMTANSKFNCPFILNHRRQQGTQKPSHFILTFGILQKICKQTVFHLQSCIGYLHLFLNVLLQLYALEAQDYHKCEKKQKNGRNSVFQPVRGVFFNQMSSTQFFLSYLRPTHMFIHHTKQSHKKCLSNPILVLP